jgi:hypothetical protein
VKYNIPVPPYKTFALQQKAFALSAKALTLPYKASALAAKDPAPTPKEFMVTYTFLVQLYKKSARIPH